MYALSEHIGRFRGLVGEVVGDPDSPNASLLWDMGNHISVLARQLEERVESAEHKAFGKPWEEAEH